MNTLAKDPSAFFKHAALENSDNGRGAYELGSSYNTGHQSLGVAPHLIIYLWHGMFWNALETSSSRIQASTESCCCQSYILGLIPSDRTICMQSSSTLSWLEGGGGVKHQPQLSSELLSMQSEHMHMGQKQAGPWQGLPLPELTICSQMLVVKTWFFSSLKSKKKRVT